MLGTLRRTRAVKAVNYARLDGGSGDEDDDDDFRPVEASSKSRKKVKDDDPAKEKPKPKPEKRTSQNASDAPEVVAPKPKRLSLEEKLLDRDLKTALRLSQQECTVVHGLPEVQKSEQRADTPAEEVAVTVEVETTAVVEPTDPSATVQESVKLDNDGTRSDEEDRLPTSDTGEDSASDTSEGSLPEPVRKAAVEPRGVRKKSSAGRAGPSLLPRKALQDGGKTTAIRSAGATSASLPRPTSASLPKPTVPVPSTRKSTNGSPNVPRPSIRLGLSRRHVGKPLHRVVRVEQ